MPRPRGTRRSQSLHICGETGDIVGRSLHVIADVIGPRGGVFFALLEGAVGAAVRSRVIDGLALFEEFDGAVDVFRFRGLGRYRGDPEKEARRCSEAISELHGVFHADLLYARQRPFGMRPKPVAAR